ncbi:MAG: 4Fe-4S binding protein [Hyphomicrobiales bacterium]|nr:4Fe-4S binding protein [Hyphomicrobiales bacterium]
MTDARRIVFACSCEDTSPADPAAIAAGCPGEIRGARQLCRAELARFQAALGENAAITVGCTQEAPLFAETAEAANFAQPLAFANIRETAGWSSEAAEALPKMSALLAAAAIEAPAPAAVALNSAGVALVYGRDETAIRVGERLKDTLNVTVLLARPTDVTPPRRADFPVAKGVITRASGHLGAFELAVEDFALPAPSSRDALRFGPGGAGQSRCDILIDVSGGPALFAAPDLRQGYLRADPGDRAAVERVAFDASQLVGEFEKPRFIKFSESLCAHSRSRKTGCTRCLELCPAGAITPAGNTVAISAELCMGCGACASVCPTGAAAYDHPPANVLLTRLRALLLAYCEAGGGEAALLAHGEEHGGAIIDALARHGDGLPARVIPFALNEITQLGLEFFAAAFAYGAASVTLLAPAKPKHDMSGLARNIGYANTALAALGYGAELCRLIETDDPDALNDALAARPRANASPARARFAPLGSGRNLLKTAMLELRAAAPQKISRVAMPERAPFGAVVVNTDGCTLCHACVTACPTGALADNPDKPMLRFSEDLCVQCGLCQSTCPERVIRLEPRIDFDAWAAPAVVLKEEEPFPCISCGKPFGSKSAIERIAGKLEGKHWMFSGGNEKRIAVIKMCDTCRVEAVMNESFDPHGAPARPAPRTTDDYLRERERGGGDPLG